MKKKSVLKWVFGVIATLLVVLSAGGWWLFGTLITATKIMRTVMGCCFRKRAAF